jgi:integrase
MRYRVPDGRQVQKKLGPAWTGRGRPSAGYFTKRLAEDRLREVLDEARRGTSPRMVRTGITFADATAEWLRYVEHDRERKRSTVAGYESIVRSQLLPTFGARSLDEITPGLIEQWIGSMGRAASTRLKALVLMHGIFQRARKVWGLRVNPVDEVERPPLRRSGDIQVFSPEEVWALVRASASEQDGAIFLTAAFTGLRMGSCWRWAGVTLISPAGPFVCGPATTPGI